jgi:hypothetical protein
MLDTVSIDIVMRSDRLPELLSNDHPWTFRRWATGKEHDSPTGVREGGLDHPMVQGQRTLPD